MLALSISLAGSANVESAAGRLHSSFAAPRLSGGEHEMFLKLVSAALSICLAGSIANATEKKIAKNELPAAVQKAADAEAKGAAVRGYSTETENGRREYE